MKHHLMTVLFLLLVASVGALTYWTGAVSTDWHNPSNWTAGVPTNATHAMIQTVANGRYPDTTPSLALCLRLSLQAGANVKVGTGGLWVTEYALIWGQVNLIAPSDFRTGQSLYWLEGATVNVTDASAEIYCGGGMEFAAGSNVQFARGYIEFSNTAGTDNYLKNNSANTILPNVRSRNSSGGIFYIHGDTSEDIVIDGNFHNYQNCSFQCGYDVNLIVKGNFEDDNTTVGRGVWLTHGTLVMDGITQAIELTPLSMLNNLTCSSSNSLNLIQDLFLRGTLTIASGVFDPGGWGIRIRGDWVNLVGPAAFDETGTTVTFEADWDQHCNYDEDFDALVVNKVAGYFIVDSSIADVNCFSYEWIDGGIKVLAGSFSALSLVNNYIAGEWFLQTGGTIELSNYGTGFIDLGGSLNISGGIFNIYGGIDNSWWPYPADASITMSGGTLDFKTQGVLITNATYSFTANITGGTIRVAGGFTVNRAGFLPGGGTIVLAGSADCQVSHVAGSSFFSLDINKYLETETGNLPRFETNREGKVRELTRSQIVTAASNLDINGSFFQRAGYFIAPAQMNVRGSWYKYTGHDSFTEGTGKVVFDGATNSTVYSEEDFNDLELAKTSLAWEFRVPLNSAADCDSYNWTQGTLEVSGGFFYAHEMVDDVIQGEVNLSAGSIIFVQDTATTLGLRGQLNISGGELHIWGGATDLVTAMPSGGDAGLTMSNGLLYRHGWGIGIYNNAYAFNANISGGVIRTDGNFYCDRADFNPSGGELELAGTANSYLTVTGPGLQQLRINKGSDASVMLMSDLDLNGLLTVDSGSFVLNSNHIHTTGSIIVHGTMIVNGNSWLYLNNLCYLNVESGGRLEAISYPGSLVAINTDAGYFYFNVRSGATIAASYCLFAQMSQYGVYVHPGASIDPDHSFDHCRFSWGVEGGALLTIDNSDHVGIVSPQFLTDAGGGASNVRKTIDAGIVNIVNSTGYFSGEEYDDDFYGRVLWNAGNDLPDLQIVTAEWVPATPDPWLGDSRDLKVTLVNNSLNALEGIFYLDLYYDRDTPPTLTQVGDMYLNLSEMPAGLPVEMIFAGIANYNEDLAGEWNSWLQLDSDGFIAESNENNNVYGPFHITWQDLPAIIDLDISYDPDTGLATLDWDYPLSVTKFNIYSDPDPLGDFSTAAGWSTTHSYSFSPGPNLFFRVTAERLPPSKSTPELPRTRD